MSGALRLLLFALTAAAPEPSVRVSLAAARRGTAPVVASAYGQAGPATIAARVLSLPQPGEVLAVRVTPGQAVRAGAPLLIFAAAPSALAAYRQAQAALTLAVAQRLHARQLLAQQLATRDQVAAAEKATADAQAQLTALAREGAGRPTTTLAAPFDAVVTTTPVAAGDRPAAGAPLVTLARLSGVQVRVGVEPGWRGRVHPGQAVELRPVGGGPSVAGRVIRVDAALNPRSRLVDVDIAAAEGAVLSGQAFTASIRVGEVAGWLAPHAAVVVQDGRAFVFQVAGGKAHRIAVTVAQPGREVDVVEGPLDAALPLVVDGAYQIEDGAAVRTR